MLTCARSGPLRWAPGLPGAPGAGSCRQEPAPPPRKTAENLPSPQPPYLETSRLATAGEGGFCKLQFRQESGGRSAGAGQERAGGAGPRMEAGEVRGWRWRSRTQRG